MAASIVHIRNLGIQLSQDFAVVVEKLDLRRGERLVLDAPSGAGKSTALGLISAGMEDSGLPGRVHQIGGQAIERGNRARRFAKPNVLGFVLQTNTLVPYLNTLENIRLPMQIAAQKVDPQWELHLLTVLGLDPLVDRPPTALSVGQRQRVSIARALLARPLVLLLDEPVASLDPGNVARVEGLLSELAQEAQSAVLLASHQAQSGVFALAKRARHRVYEHKGVTYSLFCDTEAAA